MQFGTHVIVCCSSLAEMQHKAQRLLPVATTGPPLPSGGFIPLLPRGNSALTPPHKFLLLHRLQPDTDFLIIRSNHAPGNAVYVVAHTLCMQLSTLATARHELGASSDSMHRIMACMQRHNGHTGLCMHAPLCCATSFRPGTHHVPQGAPPPPFPTHKPTLCRWVVNNKQVNNTHHKWDAPCLHSMQELSCWSHWQCRPRKSTCTRTLHMPHTTTLLGQACCR